MMWKEFEEIAGYKVSYDTYANVIEPMYMALPESITKQEFVKMLDKKAFALPTKAQELKKMRKIANEIFDNCGLRYYGEQERELERIAKEYAKQFLGIDPAAYTDGSNYSYMITLSGYAYCGQIMNRGCSFPYEIVIGRVVNGIDHEYERIELVKI